MLYRSLPILRRYQVGAAGGVFQLPRPTFYSPRLQYMPYVFPRRLFSNSKDPWQLLGVSPNASEEEIKKAYREKAMEYHPDRPNGSEEKFKEISAAYDQITKFSSNKSNFSRGPFSTNMHTQGFRHQDPFSRQEADKIFESIFGKEFARMAQNMDGFMHQNNGKRADPFTKHDLDQMFSGFAKEMFNQSESRYGGRTSTDTNVSVIVENGRRVKVTKTKVVERGQIKSETITKEDLGPVPNDNGYSTHSSSGQRSGGFRPGQDPLPGQTPPFGGIPGSSSNPLSLILSLVSTALRNRFMRGMFLSYLYRKLGRNFRFIPNLIRHILRK